MKVFICDYDKHSTTRHWIEYLKANHEVIVSMYFNPIYASWADVIWMEWCEGAAQEAARGSGDYEGVYDHEGVLGEKRKQHSGHWDWTGKKIYIRPIDIDIHFGHFRSVKWENVAGMFYIAPHLGDMLKKNMTYPPSLKIAETPLSIKLDEWAFRDRPCGQGRQIAWVNHNWSCKGLPFAYFALAKLIEKTGDNTWKLHIVSNGQSTEHWLFSYLDHLAKTLGISDNILKYSSAESVDKFLDDKDFLWQTSMKEGFSLICGEAMAKGLHVYMMNWESSKAIWGHDVVVATPEGLANKTITDVFSSQYFRDLAATHSHDKEIAQLRELTGL